MVIGLKAIHFVGILTVVMLLALFFYVLEDVPAFGDPHSPVNERVLLFRIKATDAIVDDLNRGILPDELRAEFEKRGLDIDGAVVRRVEEGEGKEGGYNINVHLNESEYNTREPEIPCYFVNVSEEIRIYRYTPAIRYKERTEEECGVPNMVTAVLADYRGYDTLGETTVIFTAGVAVILLLRRYGRL